MTEDQKAHLRLEGRQAFYPGGPDTLVCPYPIGGESRTFWLEGWHEARLVHSQKCNRSTGDVAHALRALSYAIGHEGAENVKDLIEAMLEARS